MSDFWYGVLACLGVLGWCLLIILAAMLVRRKDGNDR